MEGSSSKARITNRLQAVKCYSGKSYSQIAKETGLTNVYVAQLLRRQAQLKPETAPKLRASLPDLTDELVDEMLKPPLRSYDPNLIQEPSVYSNGLRISFVNLDDNPLLNFDEFCCLVGCLPVLLIAANFCRLNEAVMHFGESIKEIINEDFGDGIMSAIDFYCSVDKVKGADGKDRVVVTFDGKYLPYTEQKLEHMVSRLPGSQ
ncbi:hypothetical protein FEM48_Zijuj07G0096200 [Ziziphus jujuba var. spinosa]|uniref:Cyanate lyase C-terminal domain-containing protein n=1 Tax=Ziziphus jujuba var. spinosa TaxID=714518 RepID=A0A978V3W2_ZIZJJ|nr:hypothetical protein FEM48_Zijuj07G0096200 [Ziziphus jujuba var. spinosa]